MLNFLALILLKLINRFCAPWLSLNFSRLSVLMKFLFQKLDRIKSTRVTSSPMGTLDFDSPILSQREARLRNKQSELI